MTDRVGRALRQLKGAVLPVLDESSERERRERIAGRVLELSRELSTRRERRRRMSWGLTLAALVGSLCGLILWLSRGASEMEAAAVSEVRLVAGHASVRDGAGLAALVRGEHVLEAGALLVTAAGDSAELRLTSDTSVSVAPASELGISRQKPEPEVFEERVRLRAGRVTLSVPKLGAHGKVSVETPDALVEVHGTRFSVQIVEDGARGRHTEVSVREGRVLVRSGEQSRFLGAGDSWSSRLEQASPALPKPLPEPTIKADPETMPRPRMRRPRPAGAPPASELAAQNQLLEAAELAQRNGLPMLAVDRLDALIARYPSSELAQNARVERFRVLHRAGRHDEAAVAARDYLVHYPSGFARAEAERLLAEASP